MAAGTILTDVKKFISGIADDNTSFDDDILMYINGAFSKLTRAGVGPAEGFTVVANTLWTAYATDPKVINAVKNYITIDVKIAFDSTTLSSFVLETYKELDQEYLWTLNNYADYWDQPEET